MVEGQKNRTRGVGRRRTGADESIIAFGSHAKKLARMLLAAWRTLWSRPVYTDKLPDRSFPRSSLFFLLSHAWFFCLPLPPSPSCLVSPRCLLRRFVCCPGRAPLLPVSSFPFRVPLCLLLCFRCFRFFFVFPLRSPPPLSLCLSLSGLLPRSCSLPHSQLTPYKNTKKIQKQIADDITTDRQAPPAPARVRDPHQGQQEQRSLRGGELHGPAPAAGSAAGRGARAVRRRFFWLSFSQLSSIFVFVFFYTSNMYVFS